MVGCLPACLSSRRTRRWNGRQQRRGTCRWTRRYQCRTSTWGRTSRSRCPNGDTSGTTVGDFRFWRSVRYSGRGEILGPPGPRYWVLRWESALGPLPMPSFGPLPIAELGAPHWWWRWSKVGGDTGDLSMGSLGTVARTCTPGEAARTSTGRTSGECVDGVTECAVGLSLYTCILSAELVIPWFRRWWYVLRIRRALLKCESRTRRVGPSSLWRYLAHALELLQRIRFINAYGQQMYRAGTLLILSNRAIRLTQQSKHQTYSILRLRLSSGSISLLW
jgi:hypothetical protein